MGEDFSSDKRDSFADKPDSFGGKKRRGSQCSRCFHCYRVGLRSVLMSLAALPLLGAKFLGKRQVGHLRQLYGLG